MLNAAVDDAIAIHGHFAPVLAACTEENYIILCQVIRERPFLATLKVPYAQKYTPNLIGSC
jgi:hypothetical protein